MAYSKTTWVDGTTPLNATNMNKLENGVKEAVDNSEEDATVISFFESIGWVAPA